MKNYKDLELMGFNKTQEKAVLIAAPKLGVSPTELGRAIVTAGLIHKSPTELKRDIEKLKK